MSGKSQQLSIIHLKMGIPELRFIPEFIFFRENCSSGIEMTLRLMGHYDANAADSSVFCPFFCISLFLFQKVCSPPVIPYTSAVV